MVRFRNTQAQFALVSCPNVTKAGWSTGDTLVIERMAKAQALIIGKKEPQPTAGG